MAEKPQVGLVVIKGLLSKEDFKKRFNEILGAKAAGFISSIISVVNGSDELQKADPNTIIGSAVIAASLDLPIVPSLGFAGIVPYYSSKKGYVEAQFQIMKKGYIQLAQRSGQFETINVTEVYEGEIVSNNRFTGDITFDETKKASEKIIGYYAFMKLINGFKKGFYMSLPEIEKHAKKYSKSYQKGNGKWADKTDGGFEQMCEKTVIKLLISGYAPLSIIQQMQVAISRDSAINSLNENNEVGEPQYDDNPVNDNAVKKSELDLLTEKIIIALDESQLPETADLRKKCVELQAKKQWTFETASEIAYQLNIDVAAI